MKKIIYFTIIWATIIFSTDAMALIHLNIGDPYPQFCGKQLDGKKTCSSEFKDSIVIISFVRLGQSQSQKVMLTLQDLYTKFTGKRVSIFGIVSGDVDLQELIAFRKKNMLTFPIFLDGKREIYSKFGVFVYPSTLVIGQDKKLHYVYNSAMINFKQRLDGSTRYLLKEITEEQFDEILHPVIEKVDQKLARMQRYYNGAKKSFTNQQFSKATKLVTISLKKYPDHVLSLSLYGHILIREREYKLALEQFEKALKLDADLEEAKTGKQICLDKLHSN